MSDQPVTVINYTAPEINHLAAGLAEADLLSAYVRPYANQRRTWERALSAIPGMGAWYRGTFGRRRMPEGLLPQHIRETAVAADLLGAAIRHLPTPWGKDAAEWLHWFIQKQIARRGARLAMDVKMVVASYVVAEPAFRRTEGMRVLNYPIAHHRYIQRFVAEEAQREPEFAGTLPDWSAAPPWLEPQLDAECALAGAILVGSSFARDSFVAEGVSGEKLAVVPYGADVSAFVPAQWGAQQTSEQAFRLLFVGQIGQRKGISYLLRAYRSFRGPGTKLTLVGNIHGGAAGLAPYRDLFDHVPHLPRPALAERYRQADVFVFPTLIEGMPLVVLEAMASGLPVITTPNGPGDIVRDGIDGFVVPIRDPSAIIEKLEYLRANPDRRREMGHNARQRALEYNWRAYQERAIQTLQQLL
jgi:glycosyltransferase involved in cell wall biosynthesis